MPSGELDHIRSSLINYANRTNRLADDFEEITSHNDNKDMDYQNEALRTKEKIKLLQKEVIHINHDIKDIETQMKNTISGLKHLARDSDMNSLQNQIQEFNFETLASRDFIIKTVKDELIRTS